MLDIKKIRSDDKIIKERLQTRGQSFDLNILLQKDIQRKELLAKAEGLKRDRNKASDNIAVLKKNGKDASSEINLMKEVSGNIKKLDIKLKEISDEIAQSLLIIPNTPHESVPFGKSENDNKLIREVGKPKTFTFSPKSHVEIGENLDILDFKRGAKVTGARFTIYKGLGAKLDRSLTNFMLNVHTKDHNYTEVIPPYMVNKDSMTGTGQLPKFKDDLFHIASDDYYLIPTAEVPVTNIYKDEILNAEELPISITALTPCFRREAGSYGKDTTGLIRQHQFNKVELVKFCEPEKSYEELEKLLTHAEEILKRLEIPYRVVELCTGDLGFSAAKTYDIEVWLPSQGVYREVSSCSNFEDFQARRARIRYKPNKDSKPVFVHTINGSGVAVGRLLVAVLENYQNKDGSVDIPEKLVHYMGGIERIN